MNTLAYRSFRYAIVIAAVFSFTSCKKDKSYVYEVDGVNVTSEGAYKPNLKSTTEFISIAYSDLFGSIISNDELVKLSTAYAGFGDKKLLEEIIIKNFLKKPSVSIPTKSAMNADLNLFVKNTYRKFLNRDPNEFEQWGITNMISSDTSIVPEQVYYAIMTSNEYRYY